MINSSEELDIDSVYSGYVKSTSATAGIYVALGHNITGKIVCNEAIVAIYLQI